MPKFYYSPFHLRLLLLTLLFLAGSFIFSASMLSMSNESPKKSSETCSGVQPVDQIVIFFVDALRPDFLLPALTHHYSTGEKCDASTVGKSQRRNETMKYIEDALRNLSHPSHGFFFFADAPTVTSQRVKALTTGTIPAFLEMGANLNTDEIAMDSFLHQLHRRSVLFGDDTWLNLFPDNDNTSQWKYCKVLPPYNVSDFETNDNLVMQNLIPALTKETVENAPKDYAKLVIGHFLGVDHVGHHYNAEHPELGRQLTKLNGMLSHLVDFLRYKRQSKMRTLLLVLGDHGMTSSGDHGGDLFDEADAFLYAEFFDGKKATPPLISEESLQRKSEETEKRWREAIDNDLKGYEMCHKIADVHPKKLSAAHQVDLVPTISVLLGVPIPFSNLGRVIPEIITLVDEKADIEAVEECNWQQITKYFKEFGLKLDKAWIDNGISFRDRISQMGYFGRKTRGQMSGVGMFFGSCMLLTAAFSFLQNGDVQQCVKGGNFLGLLTALLLFFRLCTAFSNSFIVKEAVEVFSLLQGLLLAAFASVQQQRDFFFLFFVLVFMRVTFPFLYIDRSFIVQLLAANSSLANYLQTYALGTWWHVSGIVLGGATFCVLTFGLFNRIWIAVLSFAMLLSYQRPVIHHLVPLASFLSTVFVKKSATLRYASIVLWASSLCNEKYVVSAAISVFGALLPSVVRATRHMPVFSQAFILHLFSWVAFFAQENNCLFSAIDMNPFLVGLPSVHLFIGGSFVVTRAFVAFALAPMAVMLVYDKERTLGWRVCYLLVYLALLQSAFSCFSCYTHKSHLMLFSIFSPKLLFDLIVFMITIIGYAMAIFLI